MLRALLAFVSVSEGCPSGGLIMWTNMDRREVCEIDCPNAIISLGSQTIASSDHPPSDVERYASAHFLANARTLPIMD